jgi:hypothetical protein
MPTSVRVAVTVLAVLAVLLLLNSGLTWFARDALVERILDARPDISRADAEQFVLLSVVPYLMIGLLQGASAWWLARRQPWARWTGLAATALLGLLTLVSILTAGGVSAVSLLVLVLCVAGITSLLAATTRAWVPRLRSGS